MNFVFVYILISNTHNLSGIQQENRHIRQLQHENKELRAALEEHQNVLELIMSKYRQHMSCLVHSTKLEKEVLKQEKSKVLYTIKVLLIDIFCIEKKSYNYILGFYRLDLALCHVNEL